MGERKRKTPPLDRRRSLAAIPVLNEGVRSAANEAGHVVVRVTLKRGRGFLARFQPALMERTVKLDELGSFVFKQIDGQRTTQDIIEAFMARYRPNRREAELSTVDFLKSLAKRGVISVVVK